MLKAHKYRLYPNNDQKVEAGKLFGCCRFVYNWGLAKKIRVYEVNKVGISYFDLSALLTIQKQKESFNWLNDVNAICLQSSLRNLDNAFNSFFKKNNRFPKFKSKHDKQSCQFVSGININFEEETIKIGKLGEVKIIYDRTFEGKVKTCTLSKTVTGKYFLSVLFDDGQELPKKQPVTEKNTLGIDVGIKSFATLSDGSKIKNPKFLKKSEKRLAVLQRRLSKKKKGSKNRQEAKLKVALQHEKVRNQRNDFLHKLSHEIVCENQATMIACEDLSVKGMMKNNCLAKSISDVAWGTFIPYLKYKCDWYGKTFIQIGRFDASSKICNVCGNVKSDLTLGDRKWKCSSCNTEHDRDINASLNIKKFGYLRFQGTRTETK